MFRPVAWSFTSACWLGLLVLHPDTMNVIVFAANVTVAVIEWARFIRAGRNDET